MTAISAANGRTANSLDANPRTVANNGKQVKPVKPSWLNHRGVLVFTDVYKTSHEGVFSSKNISGSQNCKTKADFPTRQILPN